MHTARYLIWRLRLPWLLQFIVTRNRLYVEKNQIPPLVAGAWLCFIALALFAGWQLWGKAPATPAVITAEVVRGNIEDSVLAAGTIQAAKLINVGAQVSGQVKKLHVKLGDVVEPGQPIAEIDAATQQNNLKDAQAALGSAQSAKVSQTKSALALAQNSLSAKSICLNMRPAVRPITKAHNMHSQQPKPSWQQRSGHCPAHSARANRTSQSGLHPHYRAHGRHSSGHSYR